MSEFFSPKARTQRRLTRLERLHRGLLESKEEKIGEVAGRRAIPRQAIQLVSEYLNQFYWGLPPKLTYRGLRIAARDEDTAPEDADAIAIVSAQVLTVSGVRKDIEVPVVLRRGEMLEPSVAVVDGVPRIMGQSLVDEIIRPRTFHKKIDPRGGMFAPPMDSATLAAQSKIEERLTKIDRHSRGLYAVAGKTAQAEWGAADDWAAKDQLFDQRQQSGQWPSDTCESCQARGGCCQYAYHHRGDCCVHCGNDERDKTAVSAPEGSRAIYRDGAWWVRVDDAQGDIPEGTRTVQFDGDWWVEIDAGKTAAKREIIYIPGTGPAAMSSTQKRKIVPEEKLEQALNKIVEDGGEIIAVSAPGEPVEGNRQSQDTDCGCGVQPQHKPSEHCPTCDSISGCDCDLAGEERGNPAVLAQAGSTCLNCGCAQEMHFTDGKCRQCGRCDSFFPSGEDRQPGQPSKWNEEHYPERASRRAQKYDQGARVIVDGKPARIVEQIHEPTGSNAFDGTYRVEFQNGVTDVVSEGKIKYDEDRQTLRHKEAQAATCSCAQPNCSHGGSTSGQSCLNDAEGTRGLCYDCESFDYQKRAQNPSNWDEMLLQMPGGEGFCEDCGKQISESDIEHFQEGHPELGIPAVCEDCAEAAGMRPPHWAAPDGISQEEFERRQIDMFEDPGGQQRMFDLPEMGGKPAPKEGEDTDTCESCGATGAKPTTDIDGEVGAPNLCDACDAKYSPVPRKSAAREGDGLPAEHNDDRKADDFTPGDDVKFSEAYRTRTRGGPSYLIDSGTSGTVIRDVFEDGTQFEVEVAGHGMVIVPREHLKKARRQAQEDERASDYICPQCGSDDWFTIDEREWGDLPSDSAKTKQCGDCQYKGTQDEFAAATRRQFEGQEQEHCETCQDERNCNVCEGSGEMPLTGGKCTYCNGTGECQDCGPSKTAQKKYQYSCDDCTTPIEFDQPVYETRERLCVRCSKEKYPDAVPDGVSVGKDVEGNDVDAQAQAGKCSACDAEGPLDDNGYCPECAEVWAGIQSKGVPILRARVAGKCPSCGLVLDPSTGLCDIHGDPSQSGFDFDRPSQDSTHEDNLPDGYEPMYPWAIHGDDIDAIARGTGTSLQHPVYKEEPSGSHYFRKSDDASGAVQYLQEYFKSLRDIERGGQIECSPDCPVFEWCEVYGDQPEDMREDMPMHSRTCPASGMMEEARTANTPTIDQVLREMESLKDEGYGPADLMLAVRKKYPRIAEAVLDEAHDRKIIAAGGEPRMCPNCGIATTKDSLQRNGCNGCGYKGEGSRMMQCPDCDRSAGERAWSQYGCPYCQSKAEPFQVMKYGPDW